MKGNDSIKKLLDQEYQRVEVPADLKDMLIQSVENQPITEPTKENIRKIDFSWKSIAVAASLTLIVSFTAGLLYNSNKDNKELADTCSTPEEVIYQTERAYQMLAAALNKGMKHAKSSTEAVQTKTKNIFDNLTTKNNKR